MREITILCPGVCLLPMAQPIKLVLSSAMGSFSKLFDGDHAVQRWMLL